MKVALFFQCIEVGIQLPCRGYVDGKICNNKHLEREIFVVLSHIHTHLLNTHIHTQLTYKHGRLVMVECVAILQFTENRFTKLLVCGQRPT